MVDLKITPGTKKSNNSQFFQYVMSPNIRGTYFFQGTNYFILIIYIRLLFSLFSLFIALIGLFTVFRITASLTVYTFRNEKIIAIRTPFQFSSIIVQ